MHNNRPVRLRGIFKGAGLQLPILALQYVIERTRKRESGEKLIGEAINICHHFIKDGVENEYMLAAALLSPLVVKDNGINLTLNTISRKFKEPTAARMKTLFVRGELRIENFEQLDYPEDEMDKETAFILGFTQGAGLHLTKKALFYAIEKLGGIERDDGSLVLLHAVNSCRILINRSERDDVTLAAELVHDIPQYTGTNMKQAIREIARQVSKEVSRVADLRTKKRGMSDEVHFKRIRSDIRAIKGKASGTLHNLYTMLGIFSIERANEFIREVESLLIPILETAWKESLKDSDIIVSLRDDILNVLIIAHFALELIDKVKDREEMISKLKGRIELLKEHEAV